jgi:hypothetical protein
MNPDSRSQNLTEPVSERSRLIRCNGIELGRVHDMYVLLEPVSRVTCMLDPQNARIWLECDGRPFSEVLGSLRAESLPPTRDLLEMIRALRLLGMIEDTRIHPESGVHARPEPLTSLLARPSLPDLGGMFKFDEDTATLRITDTTVGQDRELELLEALSRLASVLDDTPLDTVIQLCSQFRVVLSSSTS